MSLKFIRSSINSIKAIDNSSLFTLQEAAYQTFQQVEYKRMDLQKLIKRLSEYGENKIACDWDNVGLLVEPTGPLQVNKILVTNDLTEPVLEEAIAKKVDCIISYHPVIFAPLKRLTQAEWKQRSIVKCIENRIAVYCPHTIWDAIEGGINDWIIRAFGKNILSKKLHANQTVLTSLSYFTYR